jgi:hypothetical protein
MESFSKQNGNRVCDRRARTTVNGSSEILLLTLDVTAAIRQHWQSHHAAEV